MPRSCAGGGWTRTHGGASGWSSCRSWPAATTTGPRGRSGRTSRRRPTSRWWSTSGRVTGTARPSTSRGGLTGPCCGWPRPRVASCEWTGGSGSTCARRPPGARSRTRRCSPSRPSPRPCRRAASWRWSWGPRRGPSPPAPTRAVSARRCTRPARVPTGCWRPRTCARATRARRPWCSPPTASSSADRLARAGRRITPSPTRAAP